LLFSTFQFIDQPEIAVEVNPAYLDKNSMTELKSAGFNRFSLGIQDFNPDVLLAVNRDQVTMPLNEMIAFLKDGREYGHKS
jgi:oxygen-independent coproporphyrinogen-3 oxidase